MMKQIHYGVMLSILFFGVVASAQGPLRCEILFPVDSTEMRLARLRQEIVAGTNVQIKNLYIQEFDALFAEFAKSFASPQEALKRLAAAIESLKQENKRVSQERKILEQEKRPQFESEKTTIESWYHVIELKKVIKGQIYNIHLTPDGKNLIVNGVDPAVKMVDLTTMEKKTLYTHPDTVYYSALSPDGSKLVSVGLQGVVKMMDLTTKEVVELPYRHEQAIYHVAFSPDGTKIATSGDRGDVKVFDLQNGVEMKIPSKLNSQQYVTQSQFSADGSKLFSVGEFGAFQMIDMTTLEIVPAKLKTRDLINRFSITPDGSTLVALDYEGRVLMLDLITLEQLPSPYEHDQSAHHSFVTPDGKALITVGWDTVKMYDLIQKKEIPVPEDLKREDIRAASLSADGQRLTTVTWQGPAQTYDFTAGVSTTANYTHPALPTFSLTTPDGSKVIIGDEKGNVSLWFQNADEAKTIQALIEGQKKR